MKQLQLTHTTDPDRAFRREVEALQQQRWAVEPPWLAERRRVLAETIRRARVAWLKAGRKGRV